MAQKVCIQDRGDLEQVEEGDLIEFERGSYKHWAVYVGNEEVVHLTGVDGQPIQSGPEHVFTISGQQYGKAKVAKDNIWKVKADNKAFVNNTNDADIPARPKREIVREALSKIGEEGYNLLTRNCEHFAKFCRYGEERSDQVRTWAWFGFGVIGVAIGGLLLWLSRGGITNNNDDGRRTDNNDDGRRTDNNDVAQPEANIRSDKIVQK